MTRRVRRVLVLVALSVLIYPSYAIAKSPTDKHPSKQAADKTPGAEAPCLAWVDPANPPWAAVLCIHGLGLNASSYEALGKKLSPLGIATYAIDVRGFGSWMKADGREQVDFDACITDVEGALKAIHRAHPGLPVFLIGESMGGAIALQAGAKYPDLVSGIVSSVPAGDRFQQGKTDLKVALHLLAGGPNREFNIGKQIVEQATDKPELQATWENDPLARMKLSPKELIQFQKFMNQNHDKAKELTRTPVLIMQGAKDKLVKPEGTFDLFNEIATDDKDLIMIGNAEHLILEEGQFTDHGIDVLSAWIDKHTAGDQFGAVRTNGQPSPGANQLQARAGQPRMVRRGPGFPPRPGLPPGMMPPGGPRQFNQQMRRMGQRFGPKVPEALNALRQAPPEVMRHLQMAKAYVRLNDPINARESFKKAMQMAKESGFEKEANELILALPQAFIAPKTGAQTRGLAQRFRPRFPGMALSKGQPPTGQAAVASNTLPGGKVTVMCFGAQWSEPCQQLKQTMDKARTIYGDRAEFVYIDADDPKNADLLEQYGVSPLPTVLYLNGDGEVVSYNVGYSGDASIIAGVDKILHTNSSAPVAPPQPPVTPPVQPAPPAS